MPVLRRFRRVASPRPDPLAESVWSRARHETGVRRSSTTTIALVLVIDGLFAAGATEALVAANHPNLEVGLFTLLSVVLGTPVAYGLLYLFQACLAPLRQRDEARAQLQVEREQFSEAIGRETARFVEAANSYRESFDRKWAETEDIRGQLGRAEARVRELGEGGVARAERELRSSDLRNVREIRGEIDSGRRLAEASVGASRVTDTFHTANWDAHHHALGAIKVASAGAAHMHARRAYDLFAALNAKISRREYVADEEWLAAARQAERADEVLSILEAALME